MEFLWNNLLPYYENGSFYNMFLNFRFDDIDILNFLEEYK